MGNTPEHLAIIAELDNAREAVQHAHCPLNNIAGKRDKMFDYARAASRHSSLE